MRRCRSSAASRSTKNVAFSPVSLSSRNISRRQELRSTASNTQQSRRRTMLVCNFGKLEGPTNRQSWAHSSRTADRLPRSGREASQCSSSSANDRMASSSTPPHACLASQHLCMWRAGTDKPHQRSDRLRAAPSIPSTAAASTRILNTHCHGGISDSCESLD